MVAQQCECTYTELCKSKWLTCVQMVNLCYECFTTKRHTVQSHRGQKWVPRAVVPTAARGRQLPPPLLLDLCRWARPLSSAAASRNFPDLTPSEHINDGCSSLAPTCKLSDGQDHTLLPCRPHSTNRGACTHQGSQLLMMHSLA